MLVLMSIRQEHKPKSLSRISWAISVKTEVCLSDGREFGPIFSIAELLLSLQNTLTLNRSELHVCLDIRKWRAETSLVYLWV